jgi:hypothetical protein
MGGGCKRTKMNAVTDSQPDCLPCHSLNRAATFQNTLLVGGSLVRRIPNTLCSQSAAGPDRIVGATLCESVTYEISQTLRVSVPPW